MGKKKGVCQPAGRAPRRKINIPLLNGAERVHFTGVGGVGMSALAQFLNHQGYQVSGSDRAYDEGNDCWLYEKLNRDGVKLQAQFKSKLDPLPDCLVITRAIEGSNPELVLAEAHGVPVVKRSELLAALLNDHPSIGVSGTCGKSTTAAMVGHILECAGQSPTSLLGAFVPAYESETSLGNFREGNSDLFLAEVDESDGSVRLYWPKIAALTNIAKDHFDVQQLVEFFEPYLAGAKFRIMNAGCPVSCKLRRQLKCEAITFGKEGDVEASACELGRSGSSFRIGRVLFDLSMPGYHNIENALCAVAVARCLDVPDTTSAEALAEFRGLRRRWNILPTELAGIEVVDDFAHSPVKIANALETAHLGQGRVHAVFQPHGFGPTKFMWEEYIQVFSTSLGEQDALYILDIYDAGGSADRSVSAQKLVEAIGARLPVAKKPSGREELVESLCGQAKSGDLILVMGARDHSLTMLAQNIAEAVSW